MSSRRELSTLLEFFNLVQHENQWRNSQFYYLRQNGRVEGMGFPAIFDIERDPREEWNLTPVRAWVVGEYITIVGEYQATLKDHPNQPAFSLTDFKK